MASIPTPRGPGGGSENSVAPLLSAGQFLTTRQFDEKVGMTRADPDMVARWEDLRNAKKLSRREAAAADMLFQKMRQSVDIEKTTRDKQLNAFAERKALEQVAAAGTHQVRVAEDAARRIEEQFTEVEKQSADFRISTEKFQADSQKRFEIMKTNAEQRLFAAEMDAQERAEIVAKSVQEESDRADAIIEQERVKFERQFMLRSTAAERQKVRWDAVVANQEFEARGAEGKRDREVESATWRLDRSIVSSKSKIQMAFRADEEASHVLLLRKNHAREETGIRMNQAKERETFAQRHLEERERKAELEVLKAEKERTIVREQCDETERLQQEFVYKLRLQISNKMQRWREMVEEAERVAAQKVDNVREVASVLKRMFEDEVKVAKNRVENDRARAAQNVHSHITLVDKHVNVQKEIVGKAQKDAEKRVEKVAELTAQQHSQAVALVESSEVQAAELLGQIKTVADERVRQEVGHLMSYLDHGEKDTSVRKSPVQVDLGVVVTLIADSVGPSSPSINAIDAD